MKYSGLETNYEYLSAQRAYEHLHFKSLHKPACYLNSAHIASDSNVPQELGSEASTSQSACHQVQASRVKILNIISIKSLKLQVFH